MSNEKRSGVVKWFNDDRGFGFIGVPGGDDVFVHVTDLKKSGINDPVTEGDALDFEIMPTPRGIKATKITRVMSTMKLTPASVDMSARALASAAAHEPKAVSAKPEGA